MKRNVLVLVCLLGLTLLAKGQSSSFLQNMEEQMSALQDTMFMAGNDNERFNANERFISALENCLEMPNSFNHDFALLDKISILTSKDKFLLGRWSLPKASIPIMVSFKPKMKRAESMKYIA